MYFEFDEQKSSKNKLNHGIDFIEAQLLWDDPERVEIPARSTAGLVLRGNPLLKCGYPKKSVLKQPDL